MYRCVLVTGVTVLVGYAFGAGISHTQMATKKQVNLVDVIQMKRRLKSTATKSALLM